MAINKVVYGGQTLIDLTSDTVTDAAHILQGYVGHLANGTVVTGTGSGGVDGDNLGYGYAMVGSAQVGSAIVA